MFNKEAAWMHGQQFTHQNLKMAMTMHPALLS